MTNDYLRMWDLVGKRKGTRVGFRWLVQLPGKLFRTPLTEQHSVVLSLNYGQRRDPQNQK